MPARHPLPRAWLFTDERMGDALWSALDRVPEDGGIVFRHYRTPPDERRRLFDRVRAQAGRRLLLLAGDAQQAELWGADGSHGAGSGTGLRTAPVHSRDALTAAERNGAALVFISPVFATRSHPGAQVLERDGFSALAKQTRLPAVALGGMTEALFSSLADAYGWAGIDAWSKTPG